MVEESRADAVTLSGPALPDEFEARELLPVVAAAQMALCRAEAATTRARMLDALGNAREFICALERSLGVAAVGGLARSDYAELSAEQLRTALAEADRRVGAAERETKWLRDGERSRAGWVWKAKREAGYPDNVSFDVVWAETLAKAQANAGRRKLGDRRC